jgi:hypothetical protein
VTQLPFSLGNSLIVNGITAPAAALVYAREQVRSGSDAVDTLKRLPVRPDGRGQPQAMPEQSGERNGQLDIPVETWEQYKSWCDRVRESWRDERNDPTPPGATS